MEADFLARGWVRFPVDPSLAAWAALADEAARKAEATPAEGMLRCGGRWFVGLGAIPNDGEGRLPGGVALTGEAIAFARRLYGGPLDRGQASVVYPGYPKQGTEESEAAFGYRLRRDAAHVDGLHRIMPGRRRRLVERHAFILGLPLNTAPEGAAPLTVWEGSHEVMRAAFSEVYAGVAPADWAEADVTEIYQAARRDCFERLRRVEIAAQPGEAYLVHRLALHGVAPWGDDAGATGRRAVAYFRPDPGDHAADWWLSAP